MLKLYIDNRVKKYEFKNANTAYYDLGTEFFFH